MMFQLRKSGIFVILLKGSCNTSTARTFPEEPKPPLPMTLRLEVPCLAQEADPEGNHESRENGIHDEANPVITYPSV